MTKKILLVEDEFPIALNESQMLESYGYEVITAHEGDLAIEIINANPDIALVLMDIDLGAGIDGTEAAKQILRTRDIPVIFLTGHTEDELVKKVEEITSYGIIQKFSGQFILLQAIKMAFRLFETHQREQAKEAQLRESENKFRQMFLQHSAMKVLIDPNQNGKIIDANQAAIDYYGYTHEELTGMSICDINVLPPEQVKDFMTSAMERESNVFHFKHKLSDGRIRDVEVHSSPIAIGGETILLSIMRDITQMKETEQKLKEREQQYRLLFDNASDAIFIFQNGKTELFNKKTLEITGFTAEEYQRLTIDDIVHPDDRRRVRENYRKRLENKFPDEPYEYRIVTKQGDTRWLRLNPTRIMWKDAPACLCIAEDITERILAEKKYQTYVENAPEGIAVTSSDGSILEVNKALSTITGYTTQELIGMNITAFLVEGSRSKTTQILQAIGEHGRQTDEFPFVRKDGSIGFWHVSAVKLEEGKFLSIASDITQRREAEEQLKTALQEKEHLMQELNHRVKNNLYIISSLITLKDTSLGTQADLSDIKHQVDAIQIVHNKLTHTADFKNINLSFYLQDLLRTFFSSYSNLQVKLNIDMENVELPTKKAIPLGLITNEIATNAVKYGFIEGEAARFKATLHTDHANRQYVYTLSNSGHPFPEDISFDETGTLGMRLIKGLLTQIDGSIELQRTPKPVFTVRFPAHNG